MKGSVLLGCDKQSLCDGPSLVCSITTGFCIETEIGSAKV